MKEDVTLFFSLLRCGLGETGARPSNVSPEQAEAISRLAKRYDLAHLVFLPLASYFPEGNPMVARLQRQRLLALYRAEQFAHELEGLEQALERACIPYVPLKGAVLRHLYPQPWMRTSCDIDVLVHRDDLERASACLMATLGYQRDKEGAHDVSFFSPGGVHIELHYDLVEDGRAGEASAVLSQTWELCRPVADGMCYAMPDELFYFYHIAHMAKHVENGGCGVRPFMDLWILEQQPHDRVRRDALLRQGSLERFEKICRELAGCWFDGRQPVEDARLLQEYIFGGGIYGNWERQIAVRQSRQSSRGQYVFGRLFPPARVLCRNFPVLKKHPYLLPVVWVRRWAHFLSGGRLHRSLDELKISGNTQMVQDTAAFMERIGL